MSEGLFGITFVNDTIKNADVILENYQRLVPTLLAQGEIEEYIRKAVIYKLGTIYTSHKEKIGDIPLADYIKKLQKTLTVKQVRDDNGFVGYEVGWFTPEMAKVAIMVEYGSFTGDKIKARSYVASLMLSQERGSLRDIIQTLAQEALNDILKEL